MFSIKFKKIPNELLFELVGFVHFQRKWAHTRVATAFDHLMLEHMAKWLAQFSALAGACEAMARSIQSRIKMLPEPARNSATKAFVGALLEHVQSKPNLPQSVGFWVGLPLIEGSANYVDQSLAKAVQVVERCGDWPETMPADLNELHAFLSGLANFISMEHNIGN